MKRGRTGQIAAMGAVGYYGFTTTGDVNIKGVENDIFSENEIKTAVEIFFFCSSNEIASKYCISIICFTLYKNNILLQFFYYYT